MKGKRIFLMDQTGANVVRTRFVAFENGTISEMSDSMVGAVIPLGRAREKRVAITRDLDAVLNLAQFRAESQPNKSTYNVDTQKQLIRNPLGTTIQPARTADNGLVLTSLEKKSLGTQSAKKLFLSMDNRGDEEVRHVVFDPYNLNALKENIERLPDNVAIGGTFGTNTLNVLHSIPIGNPFRIQKMHINSSTGELMTSGQLRVLTSDLTNRSQNEDIILSDSVKADTFQTNIVTINEFNTLVDGFVGFYVEVAPKEKVTFTWMVTSVNSAYNMSDINQ